MKESLDRFLLLVQLEGIKLPWLEAQTGVSSKRWSNVKYSSAEMRADELINLGKAFPEYAYWLITGKEIPEVGQISPMTKRTKKS
jgi:hypothetical protein